jgi:hypothetical protein
LRKTLDQQRNAAVVEQPEGIGDVRPHATQAFRQFGRHLGGLCRARPETLHRYILPTSQRHAQQVADDQAEHALRTEHIDRLHDGNRLVSRRKSRRIGDQHDVAGKGDILADQAGDFRRSGMSFLSSASSATRTAGQGGISTPFNMPCSSFSSVIAFMSLSLAAQGLSLLMLVKNIKNNNTYTACISE